MSSSAQRPSATPASGGFVYKSAAERSTEIQTIINDDGAIVEYFPGFISKVDAHGILESLTKDLPFAPETVRLNEQQVTAPRLVCVVGDEGTQYRYSGSVKVATGWNPTLKSITDRVAAVCRQGFNFALCNLYRDGSDSINFHSDDERDIVENSTIASLSLGAVREFVLQHKQTGEERRVKLASGSLLLMKGRTQKLYRHAVPKDTSVDTPRINVTFRLVDGSVNTQQPGDLKMVSVLPAASEATAPAPAEAKPTAKPKVAPSRVQHLNPAPKKGSFGGMGRGGSRAPNTKPGW